MLSDTIEKNLRMHKISEVNNNMQTGRADKWEEMEDTVTGEQRATSSSD